MDRWLFALCVARSLNTLIFMSYAAALPVLRPAWGMSATAAGSISTGWQRSSPWAERQAMKERTVSIAWSLSKSGLPNLLIG